nr:hypothetical protein [Mycobacterium tuberculosis]
MPTATKERRVRGGRADPHWPVIEFGNGPPDAEWAGSSAARCAARIVADRH